MSYAFSPIELKLLGRQLGARFNPYHDKLGRFTTKPGDGSGGAVAAVGGGTGTAKGARVPGGGSGGGGGSSGGANGNGGGAVKPHEVTDTHLHAAAQALGSADPTTLREAKSFQSRFKKQHANDEAGELIKHAEKWSDSATRLRGAAEAVLTKKPPANGFERKEQAGARVLMRAVHNGTSAPELHRGIYVSDREKFVATLQKKESMDFGLASFSDNENVAKFFAGKALSGSVIFHVATGSRGLHVSPLSDQSNTLREREWITGGRFRVGQVTKKDGYVHVQLHQLATFNVAA